MTISSDKVDYIFISSTDFNPSCCQTFAMSTLITNQKEKQAAFPLKLDRKWFLCETKKWRDFEKMA
jgi:hypothetical protein